MSGGSKKVIVGYEYYLGVQLALCHGPVDSINGIIVGERDTEAPVATFNEASPAVSTIYINKPDLFGGKKREGGVRGYVDILWGHDTQPRSSYLATHQGANCPAYRGITSLVFKSFLWSMMNPYFKAPWIRFTRIFQGWRDGITWYSSKAAISSIGAGKVVINAALTTGFADSAGHTIKAHGNAQILNGALYLDGSGDYITFGYDYNTLALTNDLYLKSKDGFSIEFEGYVPTTAASVEVRIQAGWDNATNQKISGTRIAFADAKFSTWNMNAMSGDNMATVNQSVAAGWRKFRWEGLADHLYLYIDDVLFRDYTVSYSGGDAYKFFYFPFACFGLYASWKTGSLGSIKNLKVTQYQPAYDMNPAHIIYQCLTDIKWGMGYNYSDIDDVSFMAVADTLYTEKFGLSLMWDRQSDIQSFVKTILDHIDGSLYLDMVTGKFKLRLHRDDYDVGTLTDLNPSNVMEMKSFQRAGYGEFANEVIVMYTDRNGDEVPLPLQNLASIQTQGSVISTTRSYPGIRTAELASRVCMRDLRVLSTPLAKATVTTNRAIYNREAGDVVALTWPDRGISSLPMRIVKIDKGNIIDGKIEVELIEDVFSLPSESYTVSTPSSWIDTAGAPQAVAVARAVEAPYWEVFFNMSRADMDYLTPDYGFGTVIACRDISTAPLNFSLQASSDNVTYEEVEIGQFSPTGTLSTAIGKTDTALQLSSFYDLDQVELDTENGYAMIDDECVAVSSVDVNTGALVVRRGVLDTVPAEHSAGARVYFPSSGIGYDPTERTNGETTYYKPCPNSGTGTLATDVASALSLTFANRATKPYPPGQVKVNTAYYPEWIDGQSEFVLTWAHRDRLQQTVSLIDYTSGSIGPEASTTYTLRIYGESGALERTVTGLATTNYTYLSVDEIADAGLGRLNALLRFEFESVRSGLTSWQKHNHTVRRTGYGWNYGQHYG